MPLTRTITELTACGFAVALSPLDIALVLLLLLGSTPLLKSSLFSGAWFVTNSVAIAQLVTVGKGLTLSMEKGGIIRWGRSFAAGALLAWIRELDPNPRTSKISKGAGSPSWRKLGSCPSRCCC